MTKRRSVDRPRAGSAPAPPPTARDPWAWASLLALLPVLLHGRGAPLGEPVADDFDFLHHALLLGRHSWLDGGGSEAFWRPLATQTYYSLLGNLVLSHPSLVGAIHLLFLAATGLLIFRVVRLHGPGHVAAAAGSFLLLADSASALIESPSHFADVGTTFFAALALHETVFSRLPTALAALAGSLLCKENGVVVALLLPWVPWSGSQPQRGRIGWAAAMGGVTLVWALAYHWVRGHAGLELPHHLESSAEFAATPWIARFQWAFWNSLRAEVSLPAVPAARDLLYAGVALAIAAAAAARFVTDRGARQRLRAALPWVAWGTGWFLLFSAGLTVIYPIWAPYRSAFGSVGLSIAVASLLGAAQAWLVAALVVLRLSTLAMSPGPPQVVSSSAPETGAFIDFERVVRLQRLMIDTRTTLEAAFPTLPHGARVGQHYMPRGALYAFEGDKALQLWYRDTTVRWVPYVAYSQDPGIALTTIVEYQPHRAPQMALVEPAAMRALLAANDAVARSGWVEALADLERADSLQRDRGAAVFRATVASKRALCRLALSDLDQAERDARAGLDLWADNFDSRYVLASVALARGGLDEAEAQLDTLLAGSPADSSAAELLRLVRARRTHP